MKLLSRLGGPYRLAIHVVLLLACFAFLAPRVDAQVGILPLSPVVTITDTHLQAAINRTIGQSAVSPITTLQMAQLTSLDASGSLTTQIVSLSGLEHATNLTSLDLSANAITDVSSLRNLTKLRLLNLSSNTIADISPLKKLTKLQMLDISSNNITGLSGIEDMTKLTYLYLDAGYISDVSALRTLLAKPDVNLDTNILVVKEVRFVNAPTVYRAGDSVEIDVTFYNSEVRYSSTSQQTVDYSGEAPYLTIQFGGDASKRIFRAEWVEDTADDPGNTVVSFSYLVPHRASADSISITKLKVPDDTRLTYVYKSTSSFPQSFSLSANTVFTANTGLRASIALPPSLPAGNRINARAPVFPNSTRTASIPETTTTDVAILTLNAEHPDGAAAITYSLPGETGVDYLDFKIVGTELRLKNRLDYDNPTDQVFIVTDANNNELSRNLAANNEYVFVVQAASGTKPETDTQRITVTVTDVLPPLNPVLTVTGETATPKQLDLSWTQPTDSANRATVTGYDIRYQPPGVRDPLENINEWLIDVPHTSTETTATIDNLQAGTSYNVWVRATSSADSSDWVQQTASTAANSEPAFSSTAKTVDENHTGAVFAHPIATDADNDTVTYTLTGTDSASFTIHDLGSDQYELRFVNPPDYENPGDLAHTATDPTTDAAGNRVYIFYVTATSGTGQRELSSEAQRFQVTVTDVTPPGKPTGLSLTAEGDAPNELEVSWTAPSNTGKPPITDYDVQYREGTSGNFIINPDDTNADTDTSTTLDELKAGTPYYVQVRAGSIEGEGAWSDSVNTLTAANSAPSVDPPFSLTVAENAITAFATLTATDQDVDDTARTYTLNNSSEDGQHFQIDGDKLKVTGAGLDHENPVDGDGNNVYVIYIKVESGTNKRALSSPEQKFEVTVTNVVEPPGKPKELSVSGPTDTPDTLIVKWKEGSPPASTTPPATTRYVVRYRVADGGEWRGDNVVYPEDRTEKLATITGLQLNTRYNIQVQAVNEDANDERMSEWGGDEDTAWMPANNDAPAFTAPQTRFSVTENTPITTPITTFTATDADEEDAGVAVTYALGETADEVAFELDIDTDAATAVLRFKAVPDFENPADLAFEDMSDPSRNNPAGDNVYIVAVTATSGERARQLTTTLWLTITVVDVIEYDNTPPVVQRLAFTAPPSAGYTQGSEIAIEVTFDDDGVDIPANLSREDRPFITLYLGEETAANRRRAYWKGRRDGNSTIVTFAYEVQENDFATAVTVDKELGITVPPDAPIRNSAGTEAATTPVRDDGTAVRGQEQSRIEFPEVRPGRQTGGGTQPGGVPQTSTPTTLTQEVPVTGTPVLIPETVDGKFAASSVPRTPLVFNEFGNGTDALNDWLELRNVTGAAVSLKDWELSIVQNGEKKDVSLIVFPDVSVPANGLLLLTHSKPDDTRLAAGDDIASDGKNGGLAHLTLVNSGLSLPDDGKFLLILRNAKEKLGKNEAFVDVAGGGGSGTDAFIRDRTGNYDTHVWPLQVLDAPGADTEDALGSGKVWRRAKADIVGYHKDAWTAAAFTGLGYDRKVTQSAATAGTPGYPNGAAKATVATPKGSVTISEIMVDSAGGTLPQWIELYNRSKTEVLNLNRWKLEIQNVDTEELIGRPIVTLTLGEKLLQPNQTVLIVAGEARASSRSHLPADRVYNLFELHQKNLRVKTPRDTFLSTEGLYLKLTDREGELVDEIGNTDGDRRSDDAPAWALPLSYVEGSRSSIVRRYDNDVARNGKKRASWVLASRIRAIDGELYYGHAADLGTPGWRAGGALPVELSRFSVARNDAGAVVLTWATESEVDNAGFNLRRSERRDSGFTLINAALIAGAGTTGERQMYTFTDTSAKPGVEYYYQLEEVSFAGKPQTLSMRLLRGPVSASNRQLRTFGEVKRQE